MPVKVYVPTPFRKAMGNQAKVEAEGRNVAELLKDLEQRHPNLTSLIYNDQGEVPDYINIYVNNREIDSLQGKQTLLNDGDEVALIPAIAGGAVPFTEDQIVRYSRHIILPQVGGKGQRRLLESSALLIGAGGLGSPTALYLAAAGVGKLGIIDGDVVDMSNLQRQILHRTQDVGRPKTDSAADTIAALNPDVQVVKYQTVLTSDNALDILKDYDIIVNGCDNFPTRYLANDACVMLNKPLVDGSIFLFEGQVTVFSPGQGCYRCLYPTPPPPGMVPSCQEAGVFGVLPGIVGVVQATEAIKLILGIGESLAGRLLLYDALSMEFRQVKLRRNPACPVCGDNPTLTQLIDYEEFCGVPAMVH